MTISSLESSPEPELRKFIFASPVQETLRHDTSREASMILDDEVEHQDKIEADNDGPIDDPDEDTLDEDKADENQVDKDNSDEAKVYEDNVDRDKDGEENVNNLYDRLLDFLERRELRRKLEQEKLEQEGSEQVKELEDMKRLSAPEKLDRLQQESDRIEKELSETSEIEYLIVNYHILSRKDILTRLDILEQQQEEKRTFPALGPQTGQR